MLVNAPNLGILFTGFKASFAKGFAGAPSAYKSVAMTVPSTTSEEVYGWLGQFPALREWIGTRVVNNLQAHDYRIKNIPFEQTVSVSRDTIEDDQYGIFAPMFEEMGRSAAEKPDELVFKLLRNGFTTKCYDGQYFFDADHPVGNAGATPGAPGSVVSVSNMQAGSSDPWFLLDTSRPFKPIVYQERRPLGNLVSKDDDRDEHVFNRREYIYGSDGRCNVGFALWQVAYGSKAELTAENYAAARRAMQTLKGDEERPLGIRPDTLVISPNNEEAALELLNSEFLANGESNKWRGTAKIVQTPWLL